MLKNMENDISNKGMIKRDYGVINREVQKTLGE